MAKDRGEEPRIVLAKGTREQVPVTRERNAASTPRRGTRDLDRDPVDVLRMWPHTTSDRDAHTTSSRAAGTPASGNPRIEDKIVLAHLALDLYRELEQVQAVTRRSHTVFLDAALCTNQGCDARIHALRGALVEACLLVQRVVMTPTATGEVEDRIRELLDLLEH